MELIHKAGTSHIGSNFSCTEIFAAVFDRIDLNVDRFILSKGWAAANLYYFLWKKGRISKDELESYCQEGSKFIGLAEPIIPEIPFAGGSMCLGLAAGVGFAKSKKLQRKTGRVYVLESDGGMNGGVTTEAVAIAAQQDLDNLVLIIDLNGFQAMGRTSKILDLDGPLTSLYKKMRDYGWAVEEVDGHDLNALAKALDVSPGKRPLAIIARTTKGKGVSFMENDNQWHYAKVNESDYKRAMEELCRTS